MIRFDGNHILIVDPDEVFRDRLTDSLVSHGAKCASAKDISDAHRHLKNNDFDLIISNFYLSDGVIHQLIDWCSKELMYVPIFTCISYPYPTDAELSHKNSIAAVFSKSDHDKILRSLSRLLFDFSVFHENLLEMISPDEIRIELNIQNSTYYIRPSEVASDRLFFEIDDNFPKGTFGILKFSLNWGRRTQSFVLPVFYEGESGSEKEFIINHMYLNNWSQFLGYLTERQLNITHFLNKAAGF